MAKGRIEPLLTELSMSQIVLLFDVAITTERLRDSDEPQKRCHSTSVQLALTLDSATWCISVRGITNEIEATVS